MTMQPHPTATRELAMLKAALDAHAIVAITDPRGVILDVNDKFCELSQYPRAELVGATHRIVNSGLHDRAFFRGLWSSITAGRMWRGEIRNRARDGSLYWVDTVVVPMLDEHGRPERFVSIRYDVTARKQAEEAARSHEETRYNQLDSRLRCVWESVPHALTLTDAAGVVLDANPAAATLFAGAGRAALIGRGLAEHLHPEDRDAWLALQARGAAGESGFLRCRTSPAAGAARWIDCRTTPLQASEGLLSVAVDVTTQIEAEAALRHAKEAAESAERVKSAFLANMSHEIRTPLNAVLGMGEILAGTRLDEAQQGYLRTIRASGRALLDLVNDVLDYSKIESGRMELETLAFDLDQCIGDAIEIAGVLGRAKDVPIRLERAAGVPRWIQGDPGRLRQVLLNLLGNAVKFTSQGAITVRVECVAADESPQLRIAVRDSGIGIAPERQQLLFRPFAQAESSTSRKYGGTGLGLCICKQIVGLMGGSIGVRSRPGHGSEFAFTIPLFEAQPPAGAAPESAAGGPALPPLRVLLVEDNEINQLVARHMLDALGLQVDTVGDGRQAVDAVRSRACYDVVLMDVHMPVMGGPEAARLLRDNAGSGPRPWIIALSASTGEMERRACREAGMDDYVSKPLLAGALAAALARAPAAACGTGMSALLDPA